jgi:nitrite reductase/ring-hydroxylating ferredoxin subunit
MSRGAALMNETRRGFLKLTTSLLLSASGLLGLGGLLHYLSYSSEPPPKTEFDLGSSSDYPTGSRTLLPDVPALLIHTEAGYFALSLACPHLGCTVAETSGELVCPCHGSRFDANGAVLRGPARQALRTLRVEVTADDHLRLFLN